MDSPSQEPGGASVPEVVEAYLGQTGLLEERLVGPVYEVLGVDGRSYGRGEDQATILVGLGEPHLLLELALAVRLESVHRPGCEVDLTPTTPSLGFAHLVPPTFSHEGAPYAYRPALQVHVVPPEPQEFASPQARGDGQHVQGFEAIAGRSGSL